jgi:uncharacterized protein YecE (DUF72 family)
MCAASTRPGDPLLRIGTCSWKYDSWKGRYYDTGRRYAPDDYLADYARHRDTVEVDQWFWSLFPGGLRLPDPAVVRQYAESVPEDFLFTIKAPNALTLTHFYSKQPKGYAEFAGQENVHFLDPELLLRFLDLIEPLGAKRGPILFQFEYLNRRKMPSLDAFLDRLHVFFEQAPRGIDYAVEPRNPNFLGTRFFSFLKEHGLGFVYLDGYFMPPLSKVFADFGALDLPFCVIRLHGDDRGGIETLTQGNWNRIMAPKPEGLKAAARIVAENLKRKVRTFVNVNNHYEGSAPVTIERFLEILGLKS